MFPAYNPTTNDDGRRKQEDLPGRPEAIRRLEGEGEIRPRPIVYPLLNLPIFSGFPARRSAESWGHVLVDQKPDVPRQAGATGEPARPRIQQGLGVLLRPGLPAQRGAGAMCPRHGMCPDEVREKDIRKMSRADHDEPLQWHWLYIPLVAYLVLSIAPSILAPIFFVLSLFTIDVPMQPAPTPVSLLAIPLFLGLIFWPFLWLYGYARDALIKYPSSEKSLRLATIMSSAAMSLPCSLLSLSAAADGGQGTGILAFLFLIILPFLGILGWLTGRGIAWILWP